MRIRTIYLNKTARTYCPPEIICPLPKDMGQEERDLIQTLERHSLTYARSGMIMEEAKQSEIGIDIREDENKITYAINDNYPREKRLDFEEKISDIVRTEPGAQRLYGFYENLGHKIFGDA